MQIVAVIPICKHINLLIFHSGSDTHYDAFGTEIMTHCLKCVIVMIVMIVIMHFKTVDMQPEAWHFLSGVRMHQRCNELQYRQKDNGEFA